MVGRKSFSAKHCVECSGAEKTLISSTILFTLQKFLDSSKLKRHFLIHTGERDFVCPHEGCGKVMNRSN